MFSLNRSVLARSIILTGILVPLIASSQVKIKERVEITPKEESVVPTKRVQKAQRALRSDRFYYPPLFVNDPFVGPRLTLPSILTVSGSLEINGNTLGNQHAKVGIGLYGGAPAIAWKGKSGWEGIPYSGESPCTATFSAGTIPDVRLGLFDYMWTEGARTITFGESIMQYDFTGLLLQGHFGTPVPVTATATAGGSQLPEAKLDHWQVDAQNMDVTGHDSTVILFQPIDGSGNRYSPWGISATEAEVSVRVDSAGDYAFLAYGVSWFDEQSGQFVNQGYYVGRELTMPLAIQAGGEIQIMPMPFLVYDESKGTFSGIIDTVYVTVSGGGKTKTIPVVLTKEYTCAKVSLEPSTLAPGDTAAVIIKMEDDTDFQPGQKFDVWIVEEGDSVGTLVAGARTGRLLTEVTGLVTYIAPSTVDSSKKFHVEALAYGWVSGGGATSAPIDVTPILKKGSHPLSGQAAMPPARRKTVAELSRRFALQMCAMPGEVVVEKTRRASMIDLNLLPPRLTSSGEVVLKVTLKDQDGKDFESNESNATITHRLGAEASEFGGIGSQNGPAEEDRSYRDSHDGAVIASLTKKPYDGRFPLLISVEAAATPPGYAYGEITMVGPSTRGKHYRQFEFAWGPRTYAGITGKTMAQKGCATTCMAMIIQAMGVDVTPWRLNEWMVSPPTKQRYYSDSGDVNWNAAGDYIKDMTGRSLLGGPVTDQRIGLTKTNMSIAQPVDNSEIDEKLAAGFFLVAQVRRVRENGTVGGHFILITGKAGGTYSILDPASSESQTTKRRTNLQEAYEGKVFHYIVYKPRV